MLGTERVWDVAISGTLAYVIGDEITGLHDKLRVLDLSDPYQPREVGMIDIPGEPFTVTVARGLAYIADLQKGLRIIDVSDSTQPQELVVVDTEPAGTNPALEVEVIGDIAYVATSPLRAFDVSDPKNPQLIGSVTAPLVPWQLTIVTDHLYVAADFGGLLMYRIRRE